MHPTLSPYDLEDDEIIEILVRYVLGSLDGSGDNFAEQFTWRVRDTIDSDRDL